MTQFEAARFQEQGQELIVVFVSRGVMDAETRALRSCAATSGWTGTVIPVWRSPFGGIGFFAPAEWQAYFGSVTYEELTARINETLTCG